MTTSALRWALGLRIKSGPKVVLQALARLMNARTGRCFPSLKTLAEDTGLAESTVRAGLRDLEAHGLISTDRRRKNGRQTSNDYHLHVGAEPKPIGKRPDAARKAVQRAAQAPDTGVCEEASRHRNMAAGQPPDTGPEYSTSRGREDGEVSRCLPGVGLAGDDRTDLPARSARGEGLEQGRLADAEDLSAAAAMKGGGHLPSPGQQEGARALPDYPPGGPPGHPGQEADQRACEPSNPAEGLDLPKRLGAEVIILPRGDARPWSAEDWQAFFEERAGIAECDGGLLRAEAEAQAFDDCVAEWLDQRPVGSTPSRDRSVAALAAMSLITTSSSAEVIPLPRREQRLSSDRPLPESIVTGGSVARYETGQGRGGRDRR